MYIYKKGERERERERRLWLVARLAWKAFLGAEVESLGAELQRHKAGP